MSSAEILLLLGAVAVGSLLKSVTGMGLPLVAIPVVSLFVGMEKAVVIIALPNVLLNALVAWRERHALPATRDLGRLCAATMAGAVAGTVVLVSLPAAPLIVLLAVVVLGYAAVALIVPELAISARASRRWAPAVGVSAGFLQGALGISGPLVATWIHSYRLRRAAYVLSVSVLFIVGGVVQTGVLLAQNRLAGLWLVALLACVPAVSSVRVGARMRDRLHSDAFDRVVLTVLVVSTLALVIQTFA